MNAQQKENFRNEVLHLSWDELDRKELLEAVRKHFPDIYDLKYRQRFKGARDWLAVYNDLASKDFEVLQKEDKLQDLHNFPGLWQQKYNEMLARKRK